MATYNLSLKIDETPKKEENSHHAHHKRVTQYNYKPAWVASAVAAGNLVWEQLP